MMCETCKAYECDKEECNCKCHTREKKEKINFKHEQKNECYLFQALYVFWQSTELFLAKVFKFKQD